MPPTLTFFFFLSFFLFREFLCGKYDAVVSCNQVKCKFGDVLVNVISRFGLLMFGVDSVVSRTLIQNSEL